MPAAGKAPYTQDSTSFSVEHFFEAWPGPGAVKDDDFESCIKTTFGLRPNDSFVYHAIASVTLAQVQAAIRHGGAGGLHAWYLGPDGKQADVAAYVSAFAPSTSTVKALKGLASNAKKDSIRARVAENLTKSRTVPESLTIPKAKFHVNPYLDLWTWSCHNLEWAGPDASTVNIKQSHHILPVFYHHFGCVVPTYEALETIKQLAAGRPIYDVGSGNGYWTLMLRRLGLAVTAVDNGDSLWRTQWIPDTVKADGSKFLQKAGGGNDGVLLLVYPQVSGGFTAAVLAAYTGSLLCVAGTQNGNGFTAFGDVTIDRYVADEMPGWRKVVQLALPSFAAKDEALFIFERKQ